MTTTRRLPTEIVETFDNVSFDGLNPMFVVYEHPSDFPDKFVVRVWDMFEGPTNTVLVRDTLDEIREAIPQGLVKILRDESDDPVIVETYF